ncbi:hypothetical protein FF1_000467 [Malus domestica]
MAETVGETKGNPEMESESQGDLRKMESCEDKPSPRGVLEIPVTDSDYSGSSCGTSSCSEKTMGQTLMRDISIGLQMRGKGMFDALKKKSARRFSTIPVLGASYELSRRNLRRRLARIWNAEDEEEEGADGMSVTKPSWRNFDYAELAAATANFKPENLIGKGGQAEVYKGFLSNGTIVAVKRLMKKEKEKENEDRVGDFLAEVGIIAHIRHPNAARLLGFGIDSASYFSFADEKIFCVSGTAECMDWKIRFKVAIGIAEGLRYLHHDCHRRIIHRDIKASNILLTEDYEAQISDFGLAKWLPEKWTHHVVFPIEGTFGYLSPEYFMHGIVDEKTDVFAYGVLLLELITGRRAVDSTQQSLVIWAKPLLDASNMKELADPLFEDAYDPIEMKRAMVTASMCISHQSTRRPYMNRVVQMLKGEDGVADQLRQKSTAVRSLVLESCDLEDYTCSNYLSDLNRHRQLVLDQ